MTRNAQEADMTKTARTRYASIATGAAFVPALRLASA